MFFPSVNGKSILGRFKLKMKFEEIIRKAGINPKDVPKTSELPIILYDGKGKRITDDPLQFATPIFAESEKGRSSFLNFLVAVEVKLLRGNVFGESPLAFAQLTEATLFVSIPPETPRIFIR